MLELPFAVHFDIIVFVAHGGPLRLIILTKRKGAQKVPGGLCAVSINVDDRIHHHVLGEANELLEGLKQLANSGMALCFPEVSPFPYAVFDEQRRDAVWIMIIVADLAVTRFQLLDGLKVLDTNNPLFEFRQVHCEPSFRQAAVVRPKDTCSSLLLIVNRASVDGLPRLLRSVTPQEVSRLAA